MQPVEDDAGDRYLLLKRTSDGWLVRDPVTGAETYRDPGDLVVVDDEDAAPLATAASGVPAPVRRVLSAVPDERALGLLVLVVDEGPLSVRDLLARTTLCESDLHGRLAELVAADLLAEARVAGERGYEATEGGRRGVELLRA